MDIVKIMEDYRPSPTDTFVHVSVIWDLEQYKNELEVLGNAENESERILMRAGHNASDSHTTYFNLELMPQQALSLKQSRSEKAVEDLVLQLNEELPELMQGKQAAAVDFWWYIDDEIQVLRYLPTLENE